MWLLAMEGILPLLSLIGALKAAENFVGESKGKAEHCTSSGDAGDRELKVI